MNLNLIQVLFLLLIEILNEVLMMICCCRHIGFEMMIDLGLLSSLCEMMNSYEIYLYLLNMVCWKNFAELYLLNMVYFLTLVDHDPLSTILVCICLWSMMMVLVYSSLVHMVSDFVVEVILIVHVLRTDPVVSMLVWLGLMKFSVLLEVVVMKM